MNCGAYWNVQISSSKLQVTPQAHRLVEQTFGAKIATSENFWFQMHRIKKNVLSQSLQFHFNCRTLKDKHIFYSKLVCLKWFESAVSNKWGMEDFTRSKSSESKPYIQNKTWSKKYKIKYLP